MALTGLLITYSAETSATIRDGHQMFSASLYLEVYLCLEHCWVVIRHWPAR